MRTLDPVLDTCTSTSPRGDSCETARARVLWSDDPPRKCCHLGPPCDAALRRVALAGWRAALVLAVAYGALATERRAREQLAALGDPDQLGPLPPPIHAENGAR